MKTTIKETINVSRNLATLKNCEICGKIIPKDSCEAYYSYACCLQAMDNMVCAFGGSLEDAEKEIRSLCECVY